MDLSHFSQRDAGNAAFGKLLNFAVFGESFPSLLLEPKEMDQSGDKLNKIAELADFLIVDDLQLRFLYLLQNQLEVLLPLRQIDTQTLNQVVGVNKPRFDLLVELDFKELKVVILIFFSQLQNSPEILGLSEFANNCRRVVTLYLTYLL
jgi:hypothetical protein